MSDHSSVQAGETFSGLRSRAKEILSRLDGRHFADDGLDQRQLLEELNVYHIELELQNEELRKTRDHLDVSRRYFDGLFANAPLGYVVLDAQGCMRKVNKQAATLLGMSSKILSGQRLLAFIPHQALAGYTGCLEAVRRERKPQHAEIVVRAKEGKSVWCRIDFFLMEDPDSSDELILCSLLNMEREKQAEQELLDLNRTLESLVNERTRELREANRALAEEVEIRRLAEEEARGYAEKQKTLVREVHHRVKNNMQVMISLMKLQARKVDNSDARQVLEESQRRIHALAMIHEILYQSENLAVIPLADYLGRLMRHIAVAYDTSRKGVRLVLKSAVANLHIDQAVPVGLIAHELVTNSCKYAFPSARGGEVSIQVRPTAEGGLELVVKDDGAGLPPEVDPQRSRSLGLRLVQRIAEDQLRGSMRIRRQAGTEIIIAFSQK